MIWLLRDVTTIFDYASWLLRDFTVNESDYVIWLLRDVTRFDCYEFWQWDLTVNESDYKIWLLRNVTTRFDYEIWLLRELTINESDFIWFDYYEMCLRDLTVARFDYKIWLNESDYMIWLLLVLTSLCFMNIILCNCSRRQNFLAVMLLLLTYNEQKTFQQRLNSTFRILRLFFLSLLMPRIESTSRFIYNVKHQYTLSCIHHHYI